MTDEPVAVLKALRAACEPVSGGPERAREGEEREEREDGPDLLAHRAEQVGALLGVSQARLRAHVHRVSLVVDSRKRREERTWVR